MKAYLEKLRNCNLFQGLTEKEMQLILSEQVNQVVEYRKDSYVFHQEDATEKIYLLLSGSIAIARETVTGRRILITNVTEPGEMFGEVYLFIEKERYDMSAKAVENSKVLSISKKLFQEKEVYDRDIEKKLQYNLLKIFAGKAYQLNRKLRILGSGSLREKIVQYLWERQDEKGMIIGKLPREEMADYMGVARPSVSRELSAMQEEGILLIEGRKIVILDQQAFEQYI